MAILKRDGSVQDFDVKKVETAVMKAMIASGSPEYEGGKITRHVGYGDNEAAAWMIAFKDMAEKRN